MVGIDMEMPKSCMECTFSEFNDFTEIAKKEERTVCFRCNIDSKIRRMKIDCYCEIRAKDCPLKEV